MTKEAEPPTKHTEPVVTGKKAFLLGTMIDYYNFLGYTNVKARLPGYDSPMLVNGTVEDARPDLTCYQNNADQTPLILEVVDDVEEVGIERRWELLSSASKIYRADLYFCAPEGSDIGLLRRRLTRLDIYPKQVTAL